MLQQTTPLHPTEVAAREREFDQASGMPPMPPALAEAAEISRAAAAKGWSVSEEARWRRTCAARDILRRELEGPYGELLRDPNRGAVAAQLYATWASHDRGEPFMESPYMVTGIYADLEAAMSAQGLPTYEERCAELGRKLVEGAIAYVLECHRKDAEAVLEGAR
jgi:hypothetical protein